MPAWVLVALTVESLFWIGLGLLFLLAAMAPGKASRMLLAAVFLSVGLVQLVPCVIALRRRLGLRPSAVEQQVISLARSEGGEVTVGSVVAAVGLTPDDAKAALDRMVMKRLCDQTGPDRYRVRGVAQTKVQRTCRYCGASLPVRERVLVCPQCGGSIELQRGD